MIRNDWNIIASFVGLIFSFSNGEPVAAQSKTHASQLSATQSVDINGFALGMHIREASTLSPIQAIGGDQFEAVKDGIEYNFGVTPKDRIYRVQSSQNLGTFSVDRTFLISLEQKLTSKYGKPTSVNGDVFSWELVERIENKNGHKYPFKTMWMSAYTSSGGNGVSLEMTIIDFRILWRDQAKANQKPRLSASDKIQF